MLLDIFDPKAPPTPIGIDLGTTNSVVAYVRDERPTALINCDGTQLLPSVVYYGTHGEVLVGSTAKAYLEREPLRTIMSAKRFMGKGADDEQTRALGAYKFAPAASEMESRVVRFDVGSRTVTPVEVSAEILKSLAKSARDQLTNIGGAVITVPAYFDDAQRQATKDAARVAGLEVLRLLNEPTAAALAYGLEKRQNGIFAVYDLGGGTFDVTLLVLEDGVFQVNSTGGDSALGGDDMDRAIATDMLCFLGLDPSTAPPTVVAVVLDAARSAKHALTDANAVELTLPGKDVAYTLTRRQFEEWIQPLLERTGKACRRALRDANLSTAEVDGVILVGGSTRVPSVRQYVASIFGKTPLSDIDPDLVVAHGAALQAHLLGQSSDEVLLLDVLPLSLGVETMGGAVDRILPRNTTIPTGAKSTFTTYADDQTGFDIHVVQGERELAADCRSLARFTLKGIPAMPAGHARLEVEFRVDENGLLAVEARELSTGLSTRVEVKPSYGLDDETVEQMLMDALDYGESDLETRRLVDAKVEAERILLATQKAWDADAHLLTPEERPAVERAMKEVRERVERANVTALAPGPLASDLQGSIDALALLTHNWAGRRMDAAIQQALAGKALGQVAQGVAHARGVDAHLAEHRGEIRESETPGTER
jgi:molecular chaperone HscA